MMCPSDEPQEEKCLYIPYGALRARGAAPKEGYRRVRVVNDRKPEQNGLYDVPPRQKGLTWDKEVRRLPPGAVRAMGDGPRPGYARVCLVSQEQPEQSGLYDVPMIELLPPRGRQRTLRSLERLAARRQGGLPTRGRLPREVWEEAALHFGRARASGCAQALVEDEGEPERSV